MKINFLKVLTLTLLSVLIFSCQSDDANSEIFTEEHQNSVSNEVVISDLTLSDITSSAKLRDIFKLHTASTKSNSFDNIYYNEEYDFAIPLNKGKLLKQGEYHSFTFPIYRFEANDVIENLLISFDDYDNYETFILSYEYSKEAFENINSVSDLGYFIPNTSAKYIEIKNIDEIISKANKPCKQTIISRATGRVIEVDVDVPGGCGSDAHISDPDQTSAQGTNGNAGTTVTPGSVGVGNTPTGNYGSSTSGVGSTSSGGGSNSGSSNQNSNRRGTTRYNTTSTNSGGGSTRSTSTRNSNNERDSNHQTTVVYSTPSLELRNLLDIEYGSETYQLLFPNTRGRSYSSNSNINMRMLFTDILDTKGNNPETVTFLKDLLDYALEDKDSAYDLGKEYLDTDPSKQDKLTYKLDILNYNDFSEIQKQRLIKITDRTLDNQDTKIAIEALLNPDKINKLNTVKAHVNYTTFLSNIISLEDETYKNLPSLWSEMSLNSQQNLSLEDYKFLSQKAQLISEKIKSDVVSEQEIARDIAMMPMLTQFKEIFKSVVPQTAEEWQAIGSILGDVLIETIPDLIPGVGEFRDALRGISALNNGDYYQAAGNFAWVIVGLIPISKIAKISFRLTVAMHKAVQIISAVAKSLKNVNKVIKKGFKFTAEGTATVLKKGDVVVAHGDEAVESIIKHIDLELPRAGTRGGVSVDKLSKFRSLPGKAAGKGKEIQGKWLRGSEGNAGFFPKSIADKMRGKNYKNFAEFREDFWKNVANDPHLSKQFDAGNRGRMKKGLAPKTLDNQKLGNKGSYEIHHNTPINQGGEVYDFDNLTIVTPRYHKEILSPEFHFGYGY